MTKYKTEQTTDAYMEQLRDQLQKEGRPDEYIQRVGLFLMRISEAEPRTVRSPEDIMLLLYPKMADLQQEQLRVLLLNARHNVMADELVYQGNVSTALIRGAEVFRAAVIAGAVAIIVSHNHPSGDPTPSPEDVAVTKELVDAGRLLGIEVLDHVIIGRNRYVSLRERGLGF